MLEKFGLDMDQVCYHIHFESKKLHDNLEDDCYTNKEKEKVFSRCMYV